MSRYLQQTVVCVSFFLSMIVFADQVMAQRAIHNPNDYDIWVCTGNYAPGVISLTGGESAPDTYTSKGWYRIPAKGNLPSAVAKTATHVFGFAYDTNGKKISFKVNDKSGQQVFYYSSKQFSKGFRAKSVKSLVSLIKKNNGEARYFPSTRAYYNPSTKRYELHGPKIEGKKQIYLTGISSKLANRYKFQFRWNPTDKWNTYTIEPGKAKFFWSGGDKVSPQIRMDQSSNPGVQEKIYRIDAFRTTLRSSVQPTWKLSRQYSLQQQGNLYKITD